MSAVSFMKHGSTPTLKISPVLLAVDLAVWNAPVAARLRLAELVA